MDSLIVISREKSTTISFETIDLLGKLNKYAVYSITKQYLTTDRVEIEEGHVPNHIWADKFGKNLKSFLTHKDAEIFLSKELLSKNYIYRIETVFIK